MLARLQGKVLTRYQWEYKVVVPLWESVWNFLKNLKIELPYDPSTPILGKYSKD
jgi:hypothetical protein